MKNRLNYILVLFLILICTSCVIKNKSLNSKQINKDNSIKIIYEFENPKAWLELKKLLANDLMSAEELGVIDCRSYDRNSAKLRLVQEVSYNILNQYYGWYIYEAKDGICVENKALHGSKIITFFLNLEDSIVLLSASIGFHFNKLGLKPLKILSKRNIFWNINGTPCGTSSTKFYKNKSITSNACEERISYRYED